MIGSSVRVLAAAVLLGGCATAAIDMEEPRRVVGTERSVRVDAEIRGDELRAGSSLPITYVIANNRSTPIAVADLVSVMSFDADGRMFTVMIGSEVPGESTLPRLIVIEPGSQKTFSTSARLAILPPRSADPMQSNTYELRLKVNFLGDITPFADLIAMEQKALIDRKRADEVFPLWIERNEVVYTGTVPVRLPDQGIGATGVPRGRTPL